MTTSNSYDFSITAGEVVTSAARKLGIVAEGEELSTAAMADGLLDLNLLIKSFPVKGIDLWRYEELTVFLDTSSQSYLIGSTGDKASFNAYKTEIAAAASSGDSIITVDSDDNITNGDVIGIELTDGTIQWTTGNGVPAANVVTLTAVLTGATTIGNHVYNYTTIAQRPERIYDGRLKLYNDSEINLTSLSLSDYNKITTKSNASIPTSYCYVPLLDNGKLYVWGVNDNVRNRLVFAAQRQLQDIDAPTNTLEFPQIFLKAIIYNLAVDMAFDYSMIDINSRHYEALKQRADEFLVDAEDFDIENTSVTFSPYGEYE